MLDGLIEAGERASEKSHLGLRIFLAPAQPLIYRALQILRNISAIGNPWTGNCQLIAEQTPMRTTLVLDKVWNDEHGDQ